MTAAVFRSSALTVPPTQNTAPVLEFNCLYTHDLRRKQKRWQDGFIRFHTFNKRVMLYDMPRNFIGDMHWKEAALQEGDEMTLEKSGVLVQVAEEVGRTETDLTELRRSAKKPRNDAQKSPAGRGGGPTSFAATNKTGVRPPSQMKHRSLNALLGTPKGPIGKSVMPSRSPYDDRHAGVENQAWRDQRPPKRRRVDASGPGFPNPDTRIAEPACNEKHSPQLTRIHAPKVVIDLRDDEEPLLPPFSSDALQPLSSPVRHNQMSASKRIQRRSSSPDMLSHEAQTTKERCSSPQPEPDRRLNSLEKGPMQPRAKRRDIASQTDMTNREATDDPSVLHDAKTLQQQPVQPEQQGLSNKTLVTGSRLRLAAPAFKRKMLVCQSDISIKPARKSSPPRNLRRKPSPEITSEDEVSLQVRRQRQRLEERLARIEEKRSKASFEAHSIGPERAGNTDDHDENARPCTPTNQASPRKQASLEKSQPSEAASVPTRLEDSRQKRKAGAPMRFTPAVPMTEKPLESAQGGSRAALKPREVHNPAAQGSANAALKSNAKQPRKNTVTLSTTTNGTSAVMLGRPFRAPQAPDAQIEAPPPCPPNPWSREAFDLFHWRPPNWNEDEWCIDTGKKA